MADVTFTCACGHRTQVSEFAVGMKTRCSACGQNVTVKADPVAPTKRTGEQEPRAHIPPELAQQWRDASGLGACPRCKKPFRGEWDRVESTHGIVCNQCAHLASEDAPKPLKPVPVPVESPIFSIGSYFPAKPVEPDEASAPFGWDPKVFRMWVLVAGLAVIVLAIVLTFTEGTSVRPLESSAVPGEEVAVEPISPWAAHLVEGLVHVSKFMAAWIALYLILSRTNSLPNDTLLKNLVSVGLVALAIYGVEVATARVTAQVTGFLIIAFLVPIVVRVIILYFLHEFYGLTLGQLLLYWLLTKIAGFLMSNVLLLCLGVVGRIVVKRGASAVLLFGEWPLRAIVVCSCMSNAG